MPTRRIAAIKRDVATGRRMKIRDGFMVERQNEECRMPDVE
jgi:hypothetical protein